MLVTASNSTAINTNDRLEPEFFLLLHKLQRHCLMACQSKLIRLHINIRKQL
uniref:Uncharacterized protein n=1 Tax=Arundo donax TaxID=35708 RepID=A0A0A9HCK1_ARUDO